MGAAYGGFLNKLPATQEIAEVENALIDGYPPSVMVGSHIRKTALRVAADRMGVEPQSLRFQNRNTGISGARLQTLRTASGMEFI